MEREIITTRAHGIDISHHQGQYILAKTWGQVNFAIAKLGEGYNSPYSTGEPGNPTEFLRLWNEGCALVPMRGAYFYQRSGYSWQLQAGKFLEAVDKLEVKPHMLWCDLEKINNTLDKAMMADTLRIMDYWFQQAPEYVTGLYTNIDILQNYILTIGKESYGPEWIARILGYPLWVAQYYGTPNGQPLLPSGVKEWKIHQYTDKGDSFKIVDGVRHRHYGSPDLDVYNGTIQQMEEWLGVEAEDAPTPPPPPVIEPPQGETMIITRGVAKVGTRTNIKLGAEIKGALVGGDTVYGELTSNREDIFFQRIYRNGQIFWDFGTKVKAVTMHLVLTDNVQEPIPSTDPAPDPDPEPPVSEFPPEITVKIGNAEKVYILKV